MSRTARHRALRLGAGLVLLGALVLGRLLPAPAEPAVVVTKVASADWTKAPDAPLFALIVGTDFRPGVDGHRADALHLASFDPARRAGAILNIPRDTWAAIPGHGSSKINSANTFGGPQLLAATVAQLTGIQPQFVISTDFAGFQGMVDELGGITVDVPMAMDDKASGAVFVPGPMRMNGFAALAFSRNRHLEGGDFTRSANQAHLILAALADLQGRGSGPADTAWQLGVLARHTRLDGVSLAELYRLGRLAMGVDPASIRSVTMPGVIGTAGGGQSVVLPAGGAAALFADIAADGTVDQH